MKIKNLLLAISALVLALASTLSFNASSQEVEIKSAKADNCYPCDWEIFQYCFYCDPQGGQEMLYNHVYSGY